MGRLVKALGSWGPIIVAVCLITSGLFIADSLSKMQFRLPMPAVNGWAPAIAVWNNNQPLPLVNLTPARNHNPTADRLPDGTPMLRMVQVPRGVASEITGPNDWVRVVVQHNTGDGPAIARLGECYNIRGFYGDPMITKHTSGWHCSEGMLPFREPPAARSANVHAYSGKFESMEYYTGAILTNGRTIYSNKITLKGVDAFYPEPRLDLTVKRNFPVGSSVGSGEAVSYTVSVTNSGDRPVQSPINSIDVSRNAGYRYMNFATFGKFGESRPYSSVVHYPLDSTKLHESPVSPSTLEFSVQGLQPGQTQEILRITLYASPDLAQTARFGVTRSMLLGANIEGAFEEALTTVR